MKEKLKTVLIILLLVLSTILILISCRTNRFCVILPGYTPRSIPSIEIDYRDKYPYNRFTEQFREADSLFYENCELPLTR